MKQEIIHKALENLKKTGDLYANWTPNGPLDGEIIFRINGFDYVFTAEVKKELRQYQLHQIENHQHEHQNLIMVAENIFPKIKEQLRLMGIAYLETNGNIFIKTKELYYFVDTHKKEKTQKETTNRAFTKTGVKVLFYFLENAELVNKTHREIAEATQVGLGTVPQVINGLKETGYLIPLNKNAYVWDNKEKLLERWVNEYAAELRPKIIKGNYTINGEWREINLNNEVTVWGGEPAADLLTNYLRPEKFILYTKETNINLIKNYRLIPNKKGELEVLELFWNNTKGKTTAPPLLVYAELLLAGGRRNLETAKMIYEEFIQPNL